MAKPNRDEWHLYHEQAFQNNVLSQPLLSGAYGLSTIVFAGTNLRNGVLLSLTLLLLSVPLSIFNNLLLKALPRLYRNLLTVLGAALLYLPLRLGLPLLFGTLPTVYMYSLPVMVFSPLVIFRTERTSLNCSLPQAVLNTVYACLAYAIVVCATGTVRELLAEGTVYGKNVAFLPVHNTTVYAAFFGLIVLGFVTALMKAIRRAPERNGGDR